MIKCRPLVFFTVGHVCPLEASVVTWVRRLFIVRSWYVAVIDQGQIWSEMLWVLKDDFIWTFPNIDSDLTPLSCVTEVFFVFWIESRTGAELTHCIRRVLSIKNRYSVSMCHSCKYIPIEIQLTRLIWCFNKEYQQNAARVSQHAETLICLIIYLHSKSVRLHV